ncbi:hypothetical protein C8Q74DRAFT_408113 [Fomes fomentarius]|nr:hypothetical protein C8Q74DRAFT_408113 [Fomes fomentarius]
MSALSRSLIIPSIFLITALGGVNVECDFVLARCSKLKLPKSWLDGRGPISPGRSRPPADDALECVENGRETAERPGVWCVCFGSEIWLVLGAGCADSFVDLRDGVVGSLR